MAGVVLLAAGFGIGDRQRRRPDRCRHPDRGPRLRDPGPLGLGLGPAAAAVAQALLPTVVGHDNGVGSGFVYDENGYIMTAAHVIQGQDEVEVRLYDGTELQGEVVGTDELNDVGVVKVDRTGLKAAPLGVGQTSRSASSRSPSAAPSASTRP